MTIAATAALLGEVFPAARISDQAYLRWLYEDNPLGRAIESNLDDAEGRAGHYALTPLELEIDGRAHRAALSLNTAVHERARGGGLFVRLAADALGRARSEGVEAVIGVANANSTPGFLRRLDFELVMPLPATVMLPTPGRAALRSGWADEPAGDALLADAETLLAPPARGAAPRWTTESLRWRLASPGSRYALHRSEDLLAVSTIDRRKTIPVAIVLAVFAPRPLDASAARAVVRAACRFHRAPAALHVGVNESVAFHGVPLPERLRESPLNLIYRDLDGSLGRHPFTRMEFIDFDAY